MPSRLLAFGLALAGGALLVDLFLPWTRVDEYRGRNVGWNSGAGFACGLAVTLLVVWEGARAAGVWSGWNKDGFAGFLLAAVAGLLGIGNLFLLRWASSFVPSTLQLAYGAWIGLALSVVLLIGAVLRLIEHRRLLGWAWVGERTAA